MKSWETVDTGRLKKILDRLPKDEGKYICRIIYRDPISRIYVALLIIYIFILIGFLLWPFDFFSFEKNDARWIENSKGVEFLETGQAVSNSSTQKFFDDLVNGSGLTLEMWLQTEDVNQLGPARILSYSINPGLRNFTVGQSRDKLVVRLRTIETNLNGTNPHLILPDIFNYRRLQHIVITYNFSEENVYINGEQKALSKILKGNFSNWDSSCKLVVGNEATGNRPWKGKIYYIAIFNRSLTEQEIHQDYLLGPHHNTNIGNTKHVEFNAKGPLARYAFDEGRDDVIHDSGILSTPVNLYIPKYITHNIKPFLSTALGSLQSDSQYSDIIINILIFIPLGILVHAMLRSRYGLTLKMSLATLLAGTLLSLGVESLQHFSMTRSSSLIDVATNMIGVVMGIVMDTLYYLFLNFQAKRLEMLIFDRKD